MSLFINISPIRESDKILADLELDLWWHDCLREDADWGDEFWKFELGCISGKLKELDRAFENCAWGFTFEAMWGGDKANEEIEVSLEELKELFENQRIGTLTRYKVTGRIKNSGR